MVGTLTRWAPRFRWPMAGIPEEMGRAMERFFGHEEPWAEMEKFVPTTNLAETETHLEATVELPGMKPEEFHVELRNGDLWITGEKKEEHEEKGKTFHRVERRYGKFERMIPLPGPVAPEKIEAQYKEGVLKVMIPKPEGAKPRQIEVKT